MDLRSLPSGLSPFDRCEERRSRIEEELGIDLSEVISQGDIGHADEKNCEQMFGQVPLPVGYAGPLPVTFSSGESTAVHLPLATTEGALVASVNRGCKALSVHGVRTASQERGITRSIAFFVADWAAVPAIEETIRSREKEWQVHGESTSKHLRLLRWNLDMSAPYLFLTIACESGEAMGMNMVTIAAEAIALWMSAELPKLQLVTVAGNVDSDKKPSRRTHDDGRGMLVTAEAFIAAETIEQVLKTMPERLLRTAEAKLVHGSALAGALGQNLHAANIVAALYLATGQDAAHVVEGSLADTALERAEGDNLLIKTTLPAVLVGVRGGGTTLPAQAACLSLLLHEKTSLPLKTQLAEAIGAAVLAGEISLLAALSSGDLGEAHRKLGR